MTIAEIRSDLNDLINEQGIETGVLVEADTMLRRLKELLDEHGLAEPTDESEQQKHFGMILP